MGFKINSSNIGSAYRPYVIAEMSGNHNHSIEKALKIVDLASDTGVDAIKLQTYTADTITMDVRGGLFEIKDPDSLWNGNNLYELYSKAYTPWEWHEQIFNHAKKRGLDCFSSPFDETAVDLLEDLNTPCYKIASFESNHHPLLKKVASTGKPVIISSGTSNLSELCEAIAVLTDNGCSSIVIMKCTSNYPADARNANLNTIPVLQDIFSDCVIGISDHTMGIGVSVAAVALGARVIEKHFTDSRSLGGVDSDFSMEPAEMKALVAESHIAFNSLGTVQLDHQKSEQSSRQFRRSIYISNNIDEGEVFTQDNIKVIRPGDGMEPKYFEQVLGKSASKRLDRGTPLTHSDIIY